METICFVVGGYINYTEVFSLLDFIDSGYKVVVISLQENHEKISKKLRSLGLRHIKIFFIDDFLKEESTNKDYIFATQTGNCVLSVFELQKKFNDCHTEDFTLFKNKKKQRSYMDADPSLRIRSVLGDGYLSGSTEQDLTYPVIIKPIGGSGSDSVYKSSSPEESLSIFSNIDTPSEYIVEEMIQGQMYTIDYFVTDQGELRVSCPVKSYLMKDRFERGDYGTHEQWIMDFSKELPFDDLSVFLKKTVEVCGIQNTFVHHEFFYDKTHGFKTIELNGRIGGYRLSMYKTACSKNLLKLAVANTDYSPVGITCHYKLYSKVDGGVFKDYIGCPFLDKNYYTNVKKVYMQRKAGDTLSWASSGGNPLGFATMRFATIEEKNEFSKLVQEYITSGSYLK